MFIKFFWYRSLPLQSDEATCLVNMYRHLWTFSRAWNMILLWLIILMVYNHCAFAFMI